MKKCTKCAATKDLSEFPINGSRERSQCKACVAERSRLWRLEHPGYAKTYMDEYAKANYPVMVERMKLKKLEIHEWKRARGCSVCGESEPWVLDMHHLDPSEKETSAAKSGTLRHFLKEASKCILLCSNCHRKVHAGVLTLSESVIQSFQASLQWPDSLDALVAKPRRQMRAGRKDGSDDAGKAQHYAQKLAEIDAQEGRKHG